MTAPRLHRALARLAEERARAPQDAAAVRDAEAAAEYWSAIAPAEAEYLRVSWPLYEALLQARAPARARRNAAEKAAYKAYMRAIEIAPARRIFIAAIAAAREECERATAAYLAAFRRDNAANYDRFVLAEARACEKRKATP